MSGSLEVLKLRVLLCFLRADPVECTVTGISRMLHEEKYKVSRAMMALERDGFVDRSQARQPLLTESGRQEGERYAQRVETSLSHLLSEGISPENAQQDAYHWALFCSEQTMDAVRAMAEPNRVKAGLGNRRQFGGAILCRKMMDGCYRFPFFLYRQQVENGSNLSVFNHGFQRPCTLCVKNGQGVVRLQAVPRHPCTCSHRAWQYGNMHHVKYLCAGRYVGAESVGGVFSIPAHVLHFENIGSGAGQVLHGSVCLRVGCWRRDQLMPEQDVIFTILV